LEKYLADIPKVVRSKSVGFFQTYQKSLLAASLLVAFYSFKTLERIPAWERTLTLVETDVKTHPNSVELNYHYGVELLKATQIITNPTQRSQQIIAAKNVLTKAIEGYPQHAEAYGELGLACYLEGNYQAAMDNYLLANQHQSNNPKVYNNLGMLHYLKKDLDQAKIAYEKAIILNPKMDEAHRNLAGILLVQKEYNKAIESYKTALRFDPNNAEVHYFMGIAFQERGDLEKAQPWLDKAYDMDPTLRSN
ncbi:MAG: tetratricopeptide repeat protein, partial [Bacteroidota bacterium]